MRRKIAAMKAAKGGKDFEKKLEASHTTYANFGIAWVRKLPVPTVYVGNGCRRLSEQQLFDYQGCFGPNAGPDGSEHQYHGLAIGMEAKSSSSEKPSLSISKDTKTSGVSIHQLQSLADGHQKFGMATALVWSNGPNLLVLTPDKILEAMSVYEDGARKSIPKQWFTPADVEEYPDGTKVCDWLYTLRCWMAQNGRASASTSPVRSYSMIPFKIDHAAGQVSYRDPETGSWKQVRPTVLGQSAIEQVARESASAEEFESKLNSLRPAFEG